jgi:hypothetical protein
MNTITADAAQHDGTSNTIDKHEMTKNIRIKVHLA